MSKSQKSRRGNFIGMVLVACQILYTAATLTAQDAPSAKKMLAQTPPMGWNSWDSYGLRINEEQFRANVEAIAATLVTGFFTSAGTVGLLGATPRRNP